MLFYFYAHFLEEWHSITPLLHVNLYINREIISADYERIVHGQSWVVGFRSRSTGKSRALWDVVLNPTLPLFYSFLLAVKVGERLEKEYGKKKNT